MPKLQFNHLRKQTHSANVPQFTEQQDITTLTSVKTTPQYLKLFDYRSSCLLSTDNCLFLISSVGHGVHTPLLILLASATSH